MFSQQELLFPWETSWPRKNTDTNASNAFTMYLGEDSFDIWDKICLNKMTPLVKSCSWSWIYRFNFIGEDVWQTNDACYASWLYVEYMVLIFSSSSRIPLTALFILTDSVPHIAFCDGQYIIRIIVVEDRIVLVILFNYLRAHWQLLYLESSIRLLAWCCNVVVWTWMGPIEP